MTFTYHRADSDEIRLDTATVALAGGTDLLSLHKLGLVAPDHVVDIKHSGIPSSIERTEDGWRLGALATLADLEDHTELRAALPVLGTAVSEAATRQLRNRATVGGNLLQRPRCRYYRDEASTCWFDGGDGCPARDGRNDHHALFDTGTCIAVQPSDLASALVALDAEVDTSERTLAVSELLAPPDEARRSLHRLAHDEVIHAIRIPDPAGARSAYRKAMDRATWAFALAGVAAVVATDDELRIGQARIVASGVATVPWRLGAVEDALLGRTLDATTIAEASALAAEGATPREHNGYKQALLRGLTRRVLEDVESGSTPDRS